MRAHSARLSLHRLHLPATDVSRSSGQIEFLPILWTDGEANDDAVADAESLQLDTIKNLRNFFSKEVLEALYT